mmetsp:Transcript_19785/g.42621  ORF Transcript_19785/g.42621 Transcript_19785/m.42621 type:complete len:332 (+) Transcript_19785:745-1740(+)|eukprot:CAMPEP_0168750868 /NCGR_PEP_ID=MMETSP0724-20121128/17518_1 /TAXON_ID=265536 /ORGANISM="Amphiprora sp., Strain CCMP467" /LENGTH=331 /DNA_ID=CAMNT_0008798951 /DNA_START=92 /DNA_END=1087 /DNA_ORIENTATION=-
MTFATAAAKPPFSGEWCIVEAHHQGKSLSVPSSTQRPYVWTITSPNTNNPHATSAINNPRMDYEFLVKIGNTLSAPVRLRDDDDDKDERLARIRVGPCSGGTEITVSPHLQDWENFIRGCLNGALLVMEIKPRTTRGAPQAAQMFDLWLQGSHGIKIVLRNRHEAEKEAVKGGNNRKPQADKEALSTQALFGGEWKLTELYHPASTLVPLPTSKHPIVWKIQPTPDDNDDDANPTKWEFIVKVGNTISAPVQLEPAIDDSNARLRRIHRMGPGDSSLQTVAPTLQALEDVLLQCFEEGLLVMERKQQQVARSDTMEIVWLQGRSFKVVLQR